jgi:hypothetical protein
MSDITIRAKFRCNHFTETTYAPYNDGTGKLISGSKARKFNFSAIYGKDGENAQFSKATPSGTLEILVDEATAAFDEWQPGKEYYLNFVEVPKP